MVFAGVKGIAKRAAKDTAKAAIGVDQSAVNHQADRSQDRDHSVNGVIGSFVPPRRNTTWTTSSKT